MSETGLNVDWAGHLSNQIDPHFDMTLRSRFSNEYCTRPKNFNIQGLRKIMEHLGVAPRQILDIGSGSGNPIMEAEKEVGTGAIVYGLEPVAALHDYFAESNDSGRFKFVQGIGEAIPFPDGSFSAVSANTT